jgi:hypothetical protein
MRLNIYNISKQAGVELNFPEVNVAIVNNGKVILSDNEAIHTVHNLDDRVLSNGVTAKQIIESKPIASTEDLGTRVRRFGDRIEGNYVFLLRSIKEIGLNPMDFPRNRE